MLEFYLLVSLIVSVFLFCIETLITLYFPYKNIKTKYIVNSIFCAIIMFSIMSYTLYLSSIVMSEITIFLISGTIGIIMSIMMYKDKMRNINQRDVITEARENLITELKAQEENLVSVNDFIGKTGKIIYKSEPEGPINTYLGVLEDNKEIFLYSIEKLEINDIFVITSYEDGKIYCERNK